MNRLKLSSFLDSALRETAAIGYHEGQFLMPDNPMPSWFGFLRVEADLAMTFLGHCKKQPFQT